MSGSGAIFLAGKHYWNNFMNVKFLVDEGAIWPEHIDLSQVVDTPEKAWAIFELFLSDMAMLD